MIEQIADLTQLQEDIQLLHSFVHGAEGDSVMLGRVNTPSLRNLVSTINKNVALLISELEGYETRVSENETKIRNLEAAISILLDTSKTVVDGSDEYNVQVLAGLVKAREITNE